MNLIITIDGPAGSGKSWLAQALAQHCGLMHVSTGLLYRALAYALEKKYGNDWTVAYAAQPRPLFVADIELLDQVEYYYSNGKAQLFYAGVSVVDQLHTPVMDALASAVATQQAVRDAVNDYVRCLAEVNDLVVDGRDCGTVLFPHAPCKLFLTADAVVRAQRVFADAARKQSGKTYEQILAALQERDTQDTTRAIAPLHPATDAILLDSSSLSKDQVLAKALAVVQPVLDCQCEEPDVQD